jgi:dihydropteroate synthase
MLPGVGQTTTVMRVFSFANQPITLLGILNVTPDSFSDGGRWLDVKRAVQHACDLAGDGAHLIDVGGESTRPNAADVAVDDELRRVVPVIEELAARGIYTSIDTRRPAVALAAIAAGASVVNDVGGLRDPNMVQVVAEAGVPVIVMHTPVADLSMTHAFEGYDNVVAQVRSFLQAQVDMCAAAGISEVVIDPGFGFGKSVQDNVDLLANLRQVLLPGHQLLVGASRKRFVGALSGIDDPALRDEATIAVHLRALQQGATAFRVHDVRRHVEAFAQTAV